MSPKRQTELIRRRWIEENGGRERKEEEEEKEGAERGEREGVGVGVTLVE